MAGKTGTAQKVDPLIRAYHPTARVASFVGAIPAEKPILSILVMVDEPQGKRYERYGGWVAAPAVCASWPCGRSATWAFSPTSRCWPTAAGRPTSRSTRRAPRIRGVSRIPPSEWLAAMRMPDLRGMSMRTVTTIASEYDLQLKVEGSGEVVSQEPAPGDLLGADKRGSVTLAPSS